MIIEEAEGKEHQIIVVGGETGGLQLATRLEKRYG
jgi:hypothetical protein